jgi:hypothetical protein
MPAKSVDNAFRLDGKRALVTGAGRGIGRDSNASAIHSSSQPAFSASLLSAMT